LSPNSVQWEPIFSIRTDTRKLRVALRNFANAPKQYDINHSDGERHSDFEVYT